MLHNEINLQHVIFVLDKVLERIRSGNVGTGEYGVGQVKGFIGEVFQYTIIKKGLKIDLTYVLRDYLEYPEHEHA